MKKLLIPVFAIIFILIGCNNYNRISYSKATVFKKKPVAEKIDEYDVYVHQDDKTYKLNEPVISEEVLSGTPVEVSIEESTEDEKLNDMHIIVNEDSKIDLAQKQTQQFDDSNVKEVEMFGKASKQLSNGGIVFLLLFIVLIVIVLLPFYILSVIPSASGGSGCYIATMTYGSYDAPQVLVLREFRDRFLEKFKAGRGFIAWYYSKSPQFVEKHRSKKWLHVALRIPLEVFVLFLRIFYSGKKASK